MDSTETANEPSLTKTQIYRMLEEPPAQSFEIPESEFGDECIALIQEYRHAVERELELCPCLPHALLSESLNKIENTQLLRLFLPNVAAVFDQFEVKTCMQMLNETINDAQQSIAGLGCKAVLDKHGISDFSDVDNLLDEEHGISAYLRERDAMKEEYREIAGAKAADDEFDILDNIVKMNILVDQTMSLESLFDTVPTLPFDRKNILNGRTLLTLLPTVQALERPAPTAYARQLNGPANAYVTKVEALVQKARLTPQGFAEFEQQAFEDALHDIYRDPAASPETLCTRIEEDMKHFTASPYTHLLCDKQCFDTNFNLDFEKLREEKAELDAQFTADGVDQGYDGDALIKEFSRGMQYQKLIDTHSFVHQLINMEFFAHALDRQQAMKR